MRLSLRVRVFLLVAFTNVAIFGAGVGYLAQRITSERQRLVDDWTDRSFEKHEFKNLLIIGITDDIDARKQFENKFVSHLRGRDVMAVTSYSLVPDLTVTEDETATA